MNGIEVYPRFGVATPISYNLIRRTHLEISLYSSFKRPPLKVLSTQQIDETPPSNKPAAAARPPGPAPMMTASNWCSLAIIVSRAKVVNGYTIACGLGRHQAHCQRRMDARSMTSSSSERSQETVGRRRYPYVRYRSNRRQIWPAGSLSASTQRFHHCLSFPSCLIRTPTAAYEDADGECLSIQTPIGRCVRFGAVSPYPPLLP